jgi:hypothetical protein
MRAHVAVRLSLLLLTISIPTVALAQFHDPTPEELKMTADPQSPGAAAVYLNVEEITNDPIHYHTFYARIKVLQEKGKELATVEVPYMHGVRKVEMIKGRTIHPDGTIIPLEGKPEDLLVVKKGESQVDKKVFNLPSVEVGSILEYTYQLSYDDNHYSSPLWEIQRPYFVHKAHYSFIPFKAFQKGPQSETSQYLVDSKGGMASTLIYTAILPPGISPKADAMGRYSVDLTDIPPAPREEWMPPMDSFLYKVLFYYSSSPSAEKYWESETKSWSKTVDHFAETSKPLKEAVAGIVGPADTDLDRAKKLYKAVQALENTDFSREKSRTELKQLGIRQAKRAEDTWEQKTGSRQDITLLYLAMARAAGLEAYDVKVVDRAKNLFSPTYLDFDQLDDDIIFLKIDGKEIVLDPGEKMAPFQTISWRHSAASGIRQSSDGSTATTTPFSPYNSNTLFRSGDVTLDPHGAIAGSIKFVMNGQEALRWRQEALRNDLAEVKKSFDRWLEGMIPDGVEAHVDRFEALDDPYQKLNAIIKVEGALGAATSKRLLLPGFFFETRGNHPFADQEKREQSVDMHYGEIVTDQMIYHLPAGLSVEAAPQDDKVSWESHSALTVKTKADPGQMTVARQLARGFTIVKPEEYQDLRGFYQKVAAEDQQQLILTNTPAPAKGN